jgi:drug/metabolite transporter (DMT)-like permease
MRRFTLFTLLYLTAGVCLTAIAFQHPDITSNTKTTLLLNAGLSYFCGILSSFPFWHRSQAGLPQDRNSIMPWVIIALILVITISNLVHHNWTLESVARASLGLLIILENVEKLLIRSQIRNHPDK